MKRKIKNRQKNIWINLLSVLVVLGLFMMTLLALNESTRHISDQKTQISVSKQQASTFFNRIKVVAQQNQKEYGVFSSITLAQAALESNFGTSQLATKYYNLFGVKGNSKNGVLLPTIEFVNGSYKQIDDYFVVYNSWDDSIRAHGQLLYYGTTWNSNQYRNVLIAKNYADAARALVTGGYATDPNYAKKIIIMIEQYHLYEYDK